MLKLKTSEHIPSFSFDPEKNLDVMIRSSKNVIDQMNQIVFFKNINFKYAYCNDKLVSFSKLKNHKHILSKEDYELPWAEDANFYRNIDKEVLLGKEMKILLEVRVASGDKIAALQNKIAIKNPETGNVIGIMVSMSEIYNSSTNEFLAQIKIRDSINIINKIQIPINYKLQNYDKYNFSARESECLFYVLRGMTTKMIAEILNRSPRTVEKFILSIKNKMGCTYKTEVIEKSIKEGLIDIIPPIIKINTTIN
ncbi:MAG: LuxR C-terminal-related transcriptional regulator [Gammaproteobacteria bacterium]